jgi:hypothetical protein
MRGVLAASFGELAKAPCTNLSRGGKVCLPYSKGELFAMGQNFNFLLKKKTSIKHSLYFVLSLLHFAA